jgi:Zn-dependent M28 family amino/carboxypeptidase
VESGSLTRFAEAAALALLAACGGSGGTPSTTIPSRTPSSANADKVAAIDPRLLAAATKYLASDLLEGRGPGTRGDQIAMEYIATELSSFGLRPGGDNGTFFQKFPLIGVTAHPPAKVVASGGEGASLTLSVPDDLVVVSGVQKDKVAIADAALVFVGYGIVAPEYRWDDYKDVDVRGKIVVVMNNDPSSDPALFAGTTRLWYGRWDYKYLQAAKKGAAGVIIIHTTPSAGYPYQVVVTSNAHEKFELPSDDEPRVLAKMWATEDASRRLVRIGGGDLDALRAAAESRDFRPTPLAVKMSLAMTNEIRSIETANVIGVVPGSDAELAKEAVIFTAHHDHLGIGVPKNGDAIYNGAVDNASGVATLLAIAKAEEASTPVKRSLVFCSVAAEEQGLLGSAWYARHPTFAPGRIAADVNMDMMNVDGPTTDVSSIAFGKSSLDDVVRAVAAEQGRTVHPNSFPERGMFYRSDQFSFAKIGVPSIYIDGGPTFVGHDAAWGMARADEYNRTKYHQPSDEVEPSWDFRGMVQDAELLFHAARRVANDAALPTWNANDEFARIPRPR